MTFNQLDDAPQAPEVVVTRDGSRTLQLAGGEGYKSLAGALTEARLVYLEASGVAERLRAGAATRVLEVGFGTGLLFLVTAELAATTGTELTYVGVENALPSADLLAELGYDQLLAPSQLPAQLRAWRESLGTVPAPGQHDLALGATRLALHTADALTCLAGPGSGSVEGTFHAVYHDAFSPRTNPDLWDARFLTALAARLKPGGRLVSFSVAGSVRRALTAAGLAVAKHPGPPGGKREVLVATRPA